MLILLETGLDALTAVGCQNLLLAQAEILVRLTCERPGDVSSCTRDPASGMVEISDDMFVTAEP